MSGDIVNLRRLRKAKQRAKEAEAAAANRLRFGRSKAQRELEVATIAFEQKLFEAHRRVSADVTAEDGSAAPEDPPDGR